jgi:hypothetical protein
MRSRRQLQEMRSPQAMEHYTHAPLDQFGEFQSHPANFQRDYTLGLEHQHQWAADRSQ